MTSLSLGREWALGMRGVTRTPMLSIRIVAVRHSQAVQRLSSATRRTESCPSRIGPISLGVKQMGARNAGNPHVACDVAGAGDVVWVRTPGHTGAPAFEPTDERG